MTWAYRQPLCFFWTIPGTVLVGPALKHLSFAEVVGAYYATSLLILVLGATGLARRALQWLPMPIVMGMVAGVFLRFGLDVVRALHSDLMIAGPMLVVFLGLSTFARLGRLLPPIIGALLVGVVMSIATARLNPALVGGLTFADPQLDAPAFSLNAMIELVVPLMITIVVVQNGQGIAVLTAAGHEPPVTAVSVACAVGGALSALVGAVGTCLTGPINGIITSSGDRERHYAAALVTAVLGIMFGLAAPTFTKLMLAAPMELIMMLGGLAMLRVLLARVHDVVQRAVRVRRAGEFSRDGRRPRRIQHRGGVLGPRRRYGHLLAARTQRLSFTRIGLRPPQIIQYRKQSVARSAMQRIGK